MKKKNHFTSLTLFWALFLLSGSLTAQAQNKSLDRWTAFKAKFTEHRNQIRKQSEYDQKVQEYKPTQHALSSDGKSLTRFKVSQKALERSGAESNACPPGDVFLANQDDVNAFGALGCTEVTGNLIIDDSGESPKITNLTPLSSLTSVTGIFQVTASQLSSLAGLSNLGTVGYLHIIGCNALVNLNGLSGLTECTGPVVNPCSCGAEHNHIKNNASLVNFAGLSNLSSVNSGLFIHDNPSLQNANGLTGLSYIGGALAFQDNPALQNVQALSNLTTVVRDLVFRRCGALKNFNGLQNLGSVGIWVVIDDNDLLKNLEGLSGLTSIGGRLFIFNNALLKNLEGLSALTTVGELIWVENNALLKNLEGLSGLTSTRGIIAYSNPTLQNLDGLPGLTHYGIIDLFLCDALKNVDALSGVTEVSEYVLLQGLYSLKNINGLSNLTWVGGTFGMAVCPLITNINALSGLTVVDGFFGIILLDNLQNLDGLSNMTSVGAVSGDDLWIFLNASLTSCCGIYQLLCADPPACSADAVGGSIVMFDNAAGCTPAEIIAGGPCSSQFAPSVEDRSGIGDATANNTVFSVYPNPVKDALNIRVEALGAGTAQLRISNSLGESLWEKQLDGAATVTELTVRLQDFTTLQPGIYFVTLVNNEQIFTRQIAVR